MLYLQQQQEDSLFPVGSTAQFMSATVEQNIPLTAPFNTTALSAHYHSLKSNKIVNVPVKRILKAMCVAAWKKE